LLLSRYFSLVSYPYSSPEAVSRRLADFAFILRDYRYAASIYDSIRKDYATDKAWKYQAGANVRLVVILALIVGMTELTKSR
jgi:hypothetical protein